MKDKKRYKVIAPFFGSNILEQNLVSKNRKLSVL